MDDGSKGTPRMTVGVDLGDQYSYLCFLDTESGEVLEESRVRTTPEAFERRFGCERHLHIAIEVGTHSPWVSRLLEECGHEVLVANARKVRLIYGEKRKRTTSSRPRTWPAWPGSIPSSFTRSGIGVRTPRLIWPSSARVRRWWVLARSWSTTLGERSSP